MQLRKLPPFNANLEPPPAEVKLQDATLEMMGLLDDDDAEAAAYFTGKFVKCRGG